MKNKLKIIDNSFSHSILGYCSDFQESENFMWDRSQSNREENLVITDNFLTSILTHEKTLLDLDYNTKFIPFGCCWVPKEEQQIYNKSKNISIISSNKTFTDGHKLRHEVIQKFGNKMDVFGRGYTPVEFKIEGLKDYRFSVVIENCKRDYWFTEKLIDCFATGTIPIYWGCPSIDDFFNTDGMLLFDNMEELVSILENCDESLYESKLESIKENFEKCKNFLLPDEHVYNFIKTL